MKKGRSDHFDADGLFQEAAGLDSRQLKIVSQAILSLSLCCFLKAAGLKDSHSEPTLSRRKLKASHVPITKIGADLPPQEGTAPELCDITTIATDTYITRRFLRQNRVFWHDGRQEPGFAILTILGPCNFYNPNEDRCPKPARNPLLLN